MLSIRTSFLTGACEVIAWHERTLVVKTPMILWVPKGSEWIILRSRVLAPVPAYTGLLALSIEEGPGKVELPGPHPGACRKCDGNKTFFGGLMCLRCGGEGTEPLDAPPMYEVIMPPQRRLVAISALLAAEARLLGVETPAGIKAARAAIDRCADAVQQALTVETLGALTAALNNAKSAWHAYVEEASPAMAIPLHVHAKDYEQAVRVEHREMMWGGAAGPMLDPIDVELTFFEKREEEAVLVTTHPVRRRDPSS